jgi:hypothetical protein
MAVDRLVGNRGCRREGMARRPTAKQRDFTCPRRCRGRAAWATDGYYVHQDQAVCCVSGSVQGLVFWRVGVDGRARPPSLSSNAGSRSSAAPESIEARVDSDPAARSSSWHPAVAVAAAEADKKASERRRGCLAPQAAHFRPPSDPCGAGRVRRMGSPAACRAINSLLVHSQVTTAEGCRSGGSAAPNRSSLTEISEVGPDSARGDQGRRTAR